VQVLQYDDAGNRLRRPGTGSDVIVGGGALVGHVIQVLAQFAARLAVNLEDRY